MTLLQKMRSLTYKTLRNLQDFLQHDELAISTESNAEDVGNIVLGVYENSISPVSRVTFMFDKLRILAGEKVQEVKYAEISEISISEPKLSARGLMVRLGEVDEVWVPIQGGNEQFRDAFEVWRFLLRANELFKS